MGSGMFRSPRPAGGGTSIFTGGENLDAGRIHSARAGKIMGAPGGWDIRWGLGGRIPAPLQSLKN